MELLHLKQIINPIVASGMQASIDILIRDKQQGSLAETRSFIVRERACRKSTDLAARHWANTRGWPIIDTEIAQYLFIRFSSASKFLQEIEPLRPEFNAPETQVLFWLLVDNWRRWGHSKWVRGAFGESFVLRRILALR